MMLSREPSLRKMVREPYDSSTASHREYTDSTLQKQEGFVISGEPETADIRSEFALAIAGEIFSSMASPTFSSTSFFSSAVILEGSSILELFA